MKTKQIILIVAVLFLAATNISAQQSSVSGTSVSYNVNIMDYSDCSCEHVPMQVAVSQFGIQYSHEAGSRFQFNHSLSYTHHDKGFRGFFDLGDEDEVVLHGHIYSYSLNAWYTINNSWVVRGHFKPQVRSYLEKHDRSFYSDFEGGVIMQYKAGNNWTFGGGYAYSRNLSEGLVHPTILMEFNNHNNFRTTIYFPEFAEVWFTPGSRFGMGVVATLAGDEFRGKEATYGRDNASVQYADFTVGPALDLKVLNHITLGLKTAYTAARHLIIESDNFREKLNPSPVWALNAGINISLP